MRSESNPNLLLTRETSTTQNKYNSRSSEHISLCTVQITTRMNIYLAITFLRVIFFFFQDGRIKFWEWNPSCRDNTAVTRQGYTFQSVVSMFSVCDNEQSWLRCTSCPVGWKRRVKKNTKKTLTLNCASLPMNPNLVDFQSSCHSVHCMLLKSRDQGWDKFIFIP